MTKIIGHRGASGLELENSRASFLAAIAHDVDIIELDTHLTADDKLVVLHDPITNRVSDTKVKISRKTLREIKTLKLRNDEDFLTLDEALDIIGTKPVFIELKDRGSIHELVLVLERHPKAKAMVVSYFAAELDKVHRVMPKVPVYLSEHFNPIAVVHTARNIDAKGIQLNKWLMNPLTYRLCKHYNLEINVYTVNSKMIARFMLFLYPNINLYTNHPERFASENNLRKAGSAAR